MLIAITRLEKHDSKSVRSSENDSNMRHELSAIAHSTQGCRTAMQQLYIIERYKMNMDICLFALFSGS
jgi:hypothetical protein